MSRQLPTEINLTNKDEFRVPEEMWEAINDFLADEYGLCVNSYGLEIKVSDIDWDTSEQEEYERNLAYDKMRHGE